MIFGARTNERKVLGKLHAANRTHAVALAREQGII